MKAPLILITGLALFLPSFSNDVDEIANDKLLTALQKEIPLNWTMRIYYTILKATLTKL
ncbi:MAG: hypothetical protein ACI8ZM_000558 [Crocinitomix sp.]|jgi:hypothetical protein